MHLPEDSFVTCFSKIFSVQILEKKAMWLLLKTFIVKSFGILHNEMALVVSSMFSTVES